MYHHLELLICIRDSVRCVAAKARNSMVLATVLANRAARDRWGPAALNAHRLHVGQTDRQTYGRRRLDR